MEHIQLVHGVNTFLLVLAAIFPVVNPPGTALVFLALTRGAAPELRRELAWRVAKNALMVLVCSLLCGALILQFYGISIPILRLAGGYVVAVAGWRLLHEGSQKGAERADDQAFRTSLLRQAFYPLTLPLTTGPGTIAVVISLGLSHPAFTDRADQIIFLVASLLAVLVISAAIFFSLCRSHPDRAWPGRNGNCSTIVRVHLVLHRRTCYLLQSPSSRSGERVAQH